MLSEDKKVEDEDWWEKITVAPSTPPDFRTHLNYVKAMKDLSGQLTAKLNKDIVTKSNFNKKMLAKKLGNRIRKCLIKS